MSIIVLSHRRTVGSGKLLADRLGGKCVTPRWKGRLQPEDVLINYGVATPPRFLVVHPEERTLNPPLCVATAVNKLACYEKLLVGGVPVPEFSTSRDMAEFWLGHGSSSHRRVFCRTLLRASQGRGIVVAIDLDEIVKAPLYTRNFPKTKEFRVHVVGDTAVHISQKRKMSPEKLKEMKIEAVDHAVRSYKRGWVFANELTISKENQKLIAAVATNAVNNLGLNFGAVDILVKGPGTEVTDFAVCEVNTAPSLSGDTTIEVYTQAIKELI